MSRIIAFIKTKASYLFNKQNGQGVNLHTPLVRVLKKENYNFTVQKSKTRENCVSMKLNTEEFKSIFTPELITLSSLFKNYGYELRIAGGAVRDLLMNKEPQDLDFATTATPDQMKNMFIAEDIRMINIQGEKHGTVTPRINDKENFEITTLRVDVCTDGRHSEVEFITDWKLDANRRDLTINSMFLGFDGTIYDYFSGYQDLLNQRVAFVGEASIRIQEDYLRILRYFRFYGRIADTPYNHEEKTLQAIKENAHGLKRVSGERIWTELQKILEGNYAGELIKTMLKLGIGAHIGLPEDPDVAEFDSVWLKAKDLNLKAITFLAALFKTQEEIMTFHSRVKLSRYERDLGLFVIEHRKDKPDMKPLRPYQLLVLRSNQKTSDSQEFVKELLKYRGNEQLLKELNQWIVPRFPVNGSMLKEEGIPGGKVLGSVLHKLKEFWIENDFNLSSAELLQHLPEVLNNMGIEPKR